MASFVVSGTRAGRPCEVSWAEGYFAGDDAAGLAIAELIDEERFVGLAPVGPYFRASSVPAGVALLTALAVLDPGGRAIVETSDDVGGDDFALDAVAIPSGAVA